MMQLTQGTGPADRSNPEWWNARYLGGDIPWDTGIVPPEVVELVESGVVSSGWALDLGCGSGVTSRFLAAHGFRVIGIDLAREALRRGQAEAGKHGHSCSFIHASVADLGFVRVRTSLAVDIGCFHSLTPADRASYIRSLGEHLAPGAHYLLYTFVFSGPSGHDCDTSFTPAVSPADVAAFAPSFKLVRAAHGEDRERSSAWFLMRRV